MTSLAQFAHELDSTLQKISHIALIAHSSPDGDAYGSLEGMKQLFVTNYPSLTISVVIPPEKYTDTHVSWVISESVGKIPAEADFVMLLDTSLLSRTALAEADYPHQPLVSIDHHEVQPTSLEGYRDIGAAANTIILMDIARELHWTITPLAATALLL